MGVGRVIFISWCRQLDEAGNIPSTHILLSRSSLVPGWPPPPPPPPQQHGSTTAVSHQGQLVEIPLGPSLSYSLTRFASVPTSPSSPPFLTRQPGRSSPAFVNGVT